MIQKISFIRYCIISLVLIASLLRSPESFATAYDEPDLISFVKEVIHHSPQHFLNEITDSGAIGINADWEAKKRDKWFIENQRSGVDSIIAGILWSDTKLIDRGLTALEWGFKQQEKDGSFNCPDNFHSTSFFVEAVARSIRLIESSAFQQHYTSRTEAMKPGLLKATSWMIRPDNKIKGDKNNQPYTHRRYLVAAALGEAGKVLHNEYLLALSWNYIKEAVSLQERDGVNPEKGGHDSSYQAVGILYAIRYLSAVAETKQSSELLPFIRKAVDWELSRIAPSGGINIDGNTRTGSSQEKTRAGKIKEVNFQEVAQMIAFWSSISKQQQLLDIAKKVVTTKSTF